MGKVVGLGGRTFAEYLRDLVDADWKESDESMGKDVHEEERAKESDDTHVPWQWRKGHQAFYDGDAIRACGYDVTFEDSRKLWRQGWVAACKTYVESRGGTFGGHEK